MQQRYILDISGALRPRWFKESDPVHIPIIKGEHDHDYDLITSELPEEFVERLYHCLLESHGPCFAYMAGDEAMKKPIGVNYIDAIRAGCTITVFNNL